MAPLYVDIVTRGTSVKNIYYITKPTQRHVGKGDFEYKPVFSVFDIGTIIPPVPLDNSTVAMMAGFNFRLLRQNGIKSHYISMVDDGEREVKIEDAIAAGKHLTKMRVTLVNRLMPKFDQEQRKWDYSMFQDPEVNNYVHPAEFIMRNEIGRNSSVWRRVRDGEVTFADLGLPNDFKPGDPIPNPPVLDYSTKFEPDDRYPSKPQIRALLGISENRLAEIDDSTVRINRVTTEYAESRGFKRPDGKIEYLRILGLDEVGDAVCTWHEDRLEWKTYPVGKQIIRTEIEILNPAWYAEIQRAKKQAKAEGFADFREIMSPNIPYLSPSPEFFTAINTLFQAGTNQWIDAKLYDPFPGKDDTIPDSLDRAIELIEQVKTRPQK